MCWILTKPAENPVPYDYIEEAQKKNKDGYGVIWFDGTTVHTYKTLDFDEFNQKLETIENHLMIVHLRAASIGSVTIENAHPFSIKDGSIYMVHNGSMRNVYCDTSCKDASDTQQLADVISACTFNKISDITPLLAQITGTTGNKLVFMESDGTITYVNHNLGIQDSNGNWYSNDYHIKEDTTLIFVYGTLKEGYSNNLYYMYNADFVDKATTIEKYAMIGKNMGFPYLLGKHPDGHHVKGELFEASKSTMRLLDQLEGYPTHYDKTEIEVLDSEGRTHKALTYIKARITPTDLNTEFIDEFIGTKPRFKYHYGRYNSAYDYDDY